MISRTLVSTRGGSRFAQERLGPALAAASGGLAPPIEPQFIPIHNEDHARLRV